MLQLIEYTFLNKVSGDPFVDFLVEIYAAKGSAPLRIYSDPFGQQLMSPIGQVLTDTEGKIKVWAPEHPQYELVLSNKSNRIILDKTSIIGVTGTDSQAPNQLSDPEIAAVRAMLTGGTPGSGTVTSVNVSGGTTGLTTSGGPITGSGTITLGGVLDEDNGGTGANNAEDAFNGLAPSTTKGDLIVFDGTTNVRFPVGDDTQILAVDSAEPAGVKWIDLPNTGSGTLPDGDYGDITASGSGTTLTIDSNVVSNTKLSDMADSTIKGRALGAGSGDPTDLSAAQVRTILNVANGATANSSDATLLARANHTGTQAASTISDFSEAVDDRVAALLVEGDNITLTYDDTAGTLTIDAATGGSGSTDLASVPDATTVTITSSSGDDAVILAATTSDAGVMSASDKSKLDGIASGATANSSDATLLNRANHTGTQTAATISDFSEAVDDRVSVLLQEGTGIDLTYNDGANTLTIAVTGVFVTDGDKGDIVVSSSGTVWSIDSSVITTAARTVLDDATTDDMRTTLGAQPVDATLTALAGVTFAADKGLYSTGADAFSTYDLTAGGRALGGVAGTANTFPYFSASNTVTLGSITAAGRSLLDDADASAQRTTLGLVIGTDVQAHSTALDQVAGLGDPNADRLVFWDDSAGSYAYLTLGSNLSITGTTLNATGGGSLADGDYGDVTVSGTGTVITIDNAAVTYAKFQDLDALSVFGRTANSSGVGASIAAGSDHEVLRRSGTSIGFGAVDLSQTAAVTGTLAVGNGGTGATSFTATQVLIGNGTSAVTSSANLTFSSNTLAVNGLQVIGGLTKSLTATSGNISIVPGTGSDVIINTTGKLRSNLTQVLQLDGNGNGITLTPGGTNDATFALDTGTTAKVAISGPSAADYASGLSANDLANKQYVDDSVTAGVALALADASLSQIVTDTKTGDYTLVLTDAGKQIDMNIVTTANTVTIPPNSSVAFPVNTVIFVSQVNTGVTTIAAGVGVTINKPASKTLALLERYEVVTLHKKATDTWQVGGGLGIA